MGTHHKTIESSKHWVSLDGHDFDLADEFEYHLQDREQSYIFQFKRYYWEEPRPGDRRLRVAGRIHPVRLKKEGIKDYDLLRTGNGHPGSNRMIFTVQGRMPIEYFITGYKRLIINSQGYREDPRGGHNQFLRIGELLNENRCGSFIMYQHTGLWILLDDPSLTLEALSSDLKDVIAFCLEESFQICFTREPEIYLSGYSMGAGAAAVTGGCDRRVTRMLLIAPSPENREELVVQCLEPFEGELYFLHGKSDEIIPYRYSRMFSKAATRAKTVDLVQLKGCGHDFAGEKFQQAFRDAYLKAFEKRPSSK